MAYVDVTDATFETEVIERSKTTPVVIDLWAEWCGPCKTLGPILEKVIGETNGKVVLAKIDVDANPGIAQAFRVQSIPAVFVAKDGQMFQGFTGAMPEHTVRQFVESLLPTEEEDQVAALIEAGDEDSLRQALELDPPNEVAIVKLADLLVRRGDDAATQEALRLIERVPENADTRRIAAVARAGAEAVGAGVETKLDALLERVKDDEAARQEFLDVLELLGPDDPRTANYRKALTSRLF